MFCPHRYTRPMRRGRFWGAAKWVLRLSAAMVFVCAMLGWHQSYRLWLPTREVYLRFGSYSLRATAEQGRVWLTWIAFNRFVDQHDFRHTLTAIISDRSARWYGKRRMAAAGTVWYPTVPFWVIAVASAGSGVLVWRKTARWRGAPRSACACWSCNYDLSGLPLGSPCPECATASPPLVPEQA